MTRLARSLLALTAMAATLTAVVWAPATTEAQEVRRPLLIEGKSTLHQRVLTRPGARLARTAAAEDGTELPPFSVFYVYGRQGGAVEVGRSSVGPAEGWIRAERTIDWNQTLTVAFNSPVNRQRTLFFREREALDRVLADPDRATVVDRLRDEALRHASPDGPVVAVEPENVVDISRRFYLLPILQAVPHLTEEGDPQQLLQVASVTANPDVSTPERNRLAELENYSGGIVFVMDTTLSMDPYIERTRDAVGRVLARIENTPLADKFRFGLVAFRNSIKLSPRLEYVTRMVADIDEPTERARFLAQLDGLKAATVSSSSFHEEPYAGLKLALDRMPWDKVQGRFIVLVTDASGRTAGDPYSETQLGPEEIRQLAAAKGVAIFVLHLMTPVGRLDHPRARAQYQELSRWPTAQPNHFPIEAGDVNRFADTVDQLTTALLTQVSTTIGIPIGGVDPSRPRDQPPSPVVRQAELVGNAMRLAYLGRREGTRAPDVFSAWTSDRDLANVAIPSLDVRVLLTKNQLSDLSASLRLVLENGLAARTAPDTFFGLLRAAAAAAARDPREVTRLERIRDLFGEYIDGLPYESPIMRVTEDQWRQMGAIAQREFINAIEAKLRLYQEFNAQTDLWVSFDGGRNPGDAMYPIPLGALP
jgi:serine/threonine-protein kinase PpkA